MPGGRKMSGWRWSPIPRRLLDDQLYLELPESARLLLYALYHVCDRNGRFAASEMSLRRETWLTSETVRMLSRLEADGFLMLYGRHPDVIRTSSGRHPDSGLRLYGQLADYATDAPGEWIRKCKDDRFPGPPDDSSGRHPDVIRTSSGQHPDAVPPRLDETRQDETRNSLSSCTGSRRAHTREAPSPLPAPTKKLGSTPFDLNKRQRAMLEAGIDPSQITSSATPSAETETPAPPPGDESGSHPSPSTRGRAVAVELDSPPIGASSSSTPPAPTAYPEPEGGPQTLVEADSDPLTDDSVSVRGSAPSIRGRVGVEKSVSTSSGAPSPSTPPAPLPESDEHPPPEPEAPSTTPAGRSGGAGPVARFSAEVPQSELEAGGGPCTRSDVATGSPPPASPPKPGLPPTISGRSLSSSAWAWCARLAARQRAKAPALYHGATAESVAAEVGDTLVQLQQRPGFSECAESMPAAKLGKGVGNGPIRYLEEMVRNWTPPPDPKDDGFCHDNMSREEYHAMYGVYPDDVSLAPPDPTLEGLWT